MTGPQGEATEVSVQLTGCREEDARSVFGVLSGVFGPGRESAAGAPRATGGANPTVWSAVFDTATAAGHPRGAALGGPVAAELQGPPQAVNRLRKTLGDAFAVSDETKVSGDQEEELRLRLETR